MFVYKNWDNFCYKLIKMGIKSIPANKVERKKSFLILKHDVECNVRSAFNIARIENKYGHCGSYYVHAYLLDDAKNVDMLRKMQAMGHEISYHYDVMDSNNGNIKSAVKEFERDILKFESLGFNVKTVCQHGNPIIERVGYTSNRDFFRNGFVKQKFANISDIMVNYKDQHNIDYCYYSDAGRKFKYIYDPINNDVINSDDKNIVYDSLDELLFVLPSKSIVSIHPHRWNNLTIISLLKEKIFYIIKKMAKIMMKMPMLKKLMSRYYYLAKKI